MKRVYSTEILANAWHIRNVLEQYDIESVIRNENLFSVAGEVPFIECMPEVWVKPLYYRRAKQIIAELESSSQARGPGLEVFGMRRVQYDLLFSLLEVPKQRREAHAR